jgi:hypothetical protein
MFGLGPRLIKKNLPGRGLTKVEKHCLKVGHDPLVTLYRLITHNYCTLLRCTIFAIENMPLKKVQDNYDPFRQVPASLFHTARTKQGMLIITENS